MSSVKATKEDQPSLGRDPSLSLTVVAAMLNEREQLESWLENLTWVDNIIIVDHGSSDGSLEFIREHPVCQCVSAPRGEGLIEDIRSFGLSEVQDGWVLVLDMDERVTEKLRDEIEELIKSQPEEDGFRIPFSHFVLGRWLKHGGWDDEHLRLFRAGKGHYTPGKIHADAIVEGEIGLLNGSILHFAHPTIHDFLMRMNRYTTQSAKTLASGEPGGLRKRVRLPESRWRWIHASASFFWTRYVKHRGFRDGMAGFVIAFLLAVYLFVEQAKAWEFMRENRS